MNATLILWPVLAQISLTLFMYVRLAQVKAHVSVGAKVVASIVQECIMNVVDAHAMDQEVRLAMARRVEEQQARQGDDDGQGQLLMQAEGAQARQVGNTSRYGMVWYGMVLIWYSIQYCTMRPGKNVLLQITVSQIARELEC